MVIIGINKSSFVRFRFRLRTLLIAVCLLAGIFGWVGFRLRQAHLQRQAVLQIVSLSGEAVYDDYFDEARRTLMETRDPGMGLAFVFIYDYEEVGFFSNVVAVDLSFHTPDHDKTLSTLGGIEMSAPITDDELTCLVGLRHLRWLRLENTLVSDKGLRHLSLLGTLEWLNLRNTSVSDEGIKDLRSDLPDCEIIH